MKNLNLVGSVFVIIVFGYIGSALAHLQSGTVGSATSGKAATDVIVISCLKGPEKPGAPIVTPTRLAFHIKDLAPVKAPIVSTQASKGGRSSPVYSDPVDGDANYGPKNFTSFFAGAGDYALRVNKSASTVKGAEAYVAEFHCWDNAGKHSTIKWKVTQNQ